MDRCGSRRRNYAEQARTGILPGRTERTTTPTPDAAAAYEHAARCVDKLRDA